MSILKENKKIVFNLLKTLNIKEIVFNYHGSGDSTEEWNFQIDQSMDCNKLLNEPLKNPVCLAVEDYNYKTRSKEVSKKEVQTLELALNILIDQVIGFGGFSGFENNEGGGGTMTFNVEDNEIEWEHNHYYMATETSSSVI